MDIETRFAHIMLLAEHYVNFVDFALDGMVFLGFSLTEMQGDIAEFMQHGPRLRMVMAQRGEAKTTLAALYAIWRIIHRPSTRVLIISAGEDNSSDTATLIVRLIMTWEILECLRPDKAAGDRTSTAAFDVHYSLKGLDRSPSIACAGITSNLPGRRADLLIPDDVESNKNGLTVTQRAQLLQLTKEFSSICTHGDILYLGTPQSKDSIYNTLEQRGYAIRIWPGRYPTPEEVEKYGDRLAPYLTERIQSDPSLQIGGGLDGTRGQAADPGRYTDEDLIEKELDKGPEDFQLQYMLDTSLADATRLQLKLSDLVFINTGADRLPEVIVWNASQKYSFEVPPDFPVKLVKLYMAVPVECAYVPPTDIFCYCDPAGGGTDELAMACGTALGPAIHILDVLGVRGGLTEENEAIIVEWLKDNRVTRILVESNMGAGLFEKNLIALLAANDLSHIGVKGEFSKGQKERRIISSLVSSMQRHRVVIHQKVVESERKQLAKYNIADRTQYSLFYQIDNITTDRDSLPHDDRIEAVAGVVREFKNALLIDEDKAAEMRKAAEYSEFMNNPMGYSKGVAKQYYGTRRSVHKKRVR
jgi:hypothetical protein